MTSFNILIKIVSMIVLERFSVRLLTKKFICEGDFQLTVDSEVETETREREKSFSIFSLLDKIDSLLHKLTDINCRNMSVSSA
ncbi:hypothetical protein Avbf_13673 [Armadillidium vulgare]|nr:hypothetical protein Avbf_13673 [Armadillidium vulgare]